MTSLSVVMATFNGARFLRPQLDSLAAQTARPAELVIGDDGSSDETLAIIEAFGRASPFPVRLERNPVRLGYSANFLRAASRATSDLIAFCDQDDVWSPDKLRAATACFENPGVLACFHNAAVIAGDGTRIGSLDRWAPAAPVSPPGTLPPWHHTPGFTQVFRRSLTAFDDLWASTVSQSRTGQPMEHDAWYVFLAATLGSVAYLSEELASYRQHGGNVCGWGGQPSLGRKLRQMGTNPAAYYGRHAAAAQARAGVMAEIAGRSGGEWSARAGAGAPRYARLAASLAARSQVYGAPTLKGRRQAFRSMSLEGHYADGPWRLGWRARLKDLGLGVVAGPLLASP